MGTVCLILIIAAVAAWIGIEHRKINWVNAVIASGISIVSTLLFAELMIGNTWYRNIGSSGEMQVSVFGMAKVLFEPLNPNAVWLWTPAWWPVNVFVIFIVSLVSLTYLRK